MSTNSNGALYAPYTLYIVAGSQEYLYFDLKELNQSGLSTGEPINLSAVQEIECRFAPYSVIKEKNVARLVKTLSSGDIDIVKGAFDKDIGRIQVLIKDSDFTQDEGAFLCQLIITDGKSRKFIAKQIIVDVGRAILPS